MCIIYKGPKTHTLADVVLTEITDPADEKCIYFCGNSLGLQPKAVSAYLGAQLSTWASIGVHGHFTTLEDSPLVEWQSMAAQASEQSAKLVGASPEEVATMGSLTMNLHLLMASFYKPTATRHKIMLEWKAFPSDHVGSILSPQGKRYQKKRTNRLGKSST